MRHIQIGKRLVGPGQPCYFIAEIGINHNGNIETARELVRIAKEAGADAVKFQKRDLEQIYLQELLDDPLQGEQAIQYMIPTLKKCRLTDDELAGIAAYCQELGITFLCTPWDLKSLELVVELDVPVIKISSADMTNLPLIEAAIQTDKPLIVSTGMSTLSEIDRAAEYLRDRECEFALLHCNSSYPAPFANINLRLIPRLMERYEVPIGYSGHERGVAVSSAAISLGACILERHVTLDRRMPGPDHGSSLEPEDLARMVADVRDVEAALGTDKKSITQGELANREVLSKSLVAAEEIPAGTTITREMIAVRSPGKGLSPQFIDKVVGYEATQPMRAGEYFREHHLGIRRLGTLQMNSSIRWALVARFNDIKEIASDAIRTIELHLTDKDLQSDFRLEQYPQEVVVHTPEYWGDTLMDLSSDNPKVRDLTVEVFNKTIATARKVAPHFEPCGERGGKVVLHPGGISRDALVDDPKPMWEHLSDSMGRLDRTGVDLLLENMPPYPWYFGGQWFHNIFMNAEQIVQFCEAHDLGVCFDTSHAMLYCNAYDDDLQSFAETVKPLVRHMHVSDARGVDGEGLQIGDGQINFERLMPVLSSLTCGFVVEIWQGHRFGGEGFWTAIERLEALIRQPAETA